MEDKTEVTNNDSKEINLRDQVEVLKRENCLLLVEREKLSAQLEKVEMAKIAREQLSGALRGEEEGEGWDWKGGEQGGVYQVEGGILQVSK